MMYVMRSMRGLASAALLFSATIAPVAAAQPPGFPDLSGFSDVTSSFTTPGGHGNPGVNFSTADGVNCGFGKPPQVTPDSQLVQCFGTLPGVQNLPITNGNTQGACDLGGAQVAGGPGDVWHYKGNCPAPSGNKILNPGQKVYYGNITCGVAPGGVTACQSTANGEHGFILQPSGSSAF
ncbi:hypothetical protein [Mycobacterium kubicae]|uniref:hypothetical protein n=1 Tax=Mycobacterium kubicae TaxID=120959 RepID=UPI00104231CF|nr:hypothetical protein [Mycobacterium kubicae]